MQTTQKTSLISLLEDFDDHNALKLVKNASIFYKGGIYYIKHYSTVIFAYDPENVTFEAKLGISQTSNRQIRSAIKFFGLNSENVINLSSMVKN